MKIDDLTNAQLVTLAVLLLGGDFDYCDYEDIAIKVNELAPRRFSWRKYPERINLEKVETSLRSAKKTINGGLITGDNVSGWMLTSNGIKFINNLDFDLPTIKISLERQKDFISITTETERRRLKNTMAYQLYISGKKEHISIEEFYQFTRINEYFKSHTKKRRFAIIDHTVDGDKELSEIWKYLKEQFT